jgi:hypothetical protein
MARLKLRWLGTFSKGARGSVALNFAPSGAANCDPMCPHYKGACYALRAERSGRRDNLVAKLIRHYKRGLRFVCNEARAELALLGSVPWFRFSAFGSVPNRIGALQLDALRALIALAQAKGARVHFPVETERKARYYRKRLGDLVCVRESATNKARFLDATTATSFVVGTLDVPMSARIAEALSVAKEKRARGRACALCPAITSRAREIHCGECTLCANDKVDIIYPCHA